MDSVLLLLHLQRLLACTGKHGTQASHPNTPRQIMHGRMQPMALTARSMLLSSNARDLALHAADYLVITPPPVATR